MIQMLLSGIKNEIWYDLNQYVCERRPPGPSTYNSWGFERQRDSLSIEMTSLLLLPFTRVFQDLCQVCLACYWTEKSINFDREITFLQS